MTRSKPAFPAAAIWIIPIRQVPHSSVHCARQRLSLLRYTRTAGYAQHSISRLDPHPVSCAGRMSGLRGPRAQDKISKRMANGMARPGNLAGVGNTPHARCWAQGFLRLAECPDSLSRRPGKSDIRASSMPTAKHVIKAGGHGPWIEWQFSFHVKHRDSILPTPGNRNIRPVSRSGPSSRIDHAGKTLPSNGLILSARTRLRLATPRQHSYVDAEICAVCITILSTAPVDNPIARRTSGYACRCRINALRRIRP